MAASGSGGYGGPNFSAVENSLRNIAVGFAAIASLQQQIGASLSVWRDLQKELTLANAAAGGTRQEFNQMEEAARNFAKASTFSAGQVANSFYALASAGLSVQETLSAATGVILLSQASLTDLGEASDVMSSSLQQFNLQATESYRISNLFVAATNSSLATVPKLAFAFRQVGPVAAQMGLSIEQTTAALDTLFDVGLRGEQAGTALRNSLVRIMNPMGQGASMLENLGLNTVDTATGKMRPFLDIMKELAAMKLSPDGIVQIFGVEAAAGATALLNSLTLGVGETTTAFEKHQRAITNTDSAYRQATQQMNTLHGTLSLLSNNFNDFRIQIGQALTPVIGALANMFGNFSNSMEAMTSEQKLGYIQTALAILQFAMFTKGVTLAVGGLGAFYGGMERHNAMVARMTAANNGAALSFGQMSRRAASLGRVLAGLGGAALGIVGVGLAIAAVIKGMKEAQQAANQIRQENVGGNILEAMAGERGLSSAATKRYTDTSENAEAFAKRAAEVKDLSPVNKETGGGAFQRLRMQTELIRQGNSDLVALDLQIKDLKTNGNRVRGELAAVGSIVQEISTTNWYSRGTAWGSPLNSTLVRDAANPMSELNKQIQEMAAMESRSVPQIRQSIAAMAKRRLEIIESMPKDQGMDGKKVLTPLARNLKAQAEQLARIGKEGTDAAIRAYAEANVQTVKYANEQAAKLSGEDAGDARATSQAIEEQFAANVSTSMILDEAGLQRLIARREQEQTRIKSTIDNLTAANKSIDGAVVKDIAQFVTSASSLSPEAMKQFNEFLKTPEGKKILEQASKDAGENHLSMAQAAQNLIRSVVAQRKDMAAIFNNGIPVIKAIALLDRAKIESAIRDNEVEYLTIQKKMAELAGNPERVDQLTREITAAMKGKKQIDIAADFVEALRGANGDDATNAAMDRMFSASGGEENFMLRLAQRLEQAAAGDAAAEQHIVRVTEQAYLNRVGNVDLLVKRVTGDWRNVNEEAKATILEHEDQQRQDRERDAADLDRRRQQNADSYAKMLEGLLALPTNEEVTLEIEGIKQNIRDRYNSYFGLTLPAITEEMNAAELKLRQDLLGMQKSYQDMFTNDIAEGLGDAVNSKDMIDAFSGATLQRIKQFGSADVLGKTFTREMIESSKGITDFIQHVTNAFANVVNGDPNATGAAERVAAFGRQMNLMVARVGATYDELVTGLALTRDKAQRAANDVREFRDEFDAEKIVRDFESALAMTGPNTTQQELELLIDVAVKAKTVRVVLDAEEAKKQLREKYEKLFQNLGVATTVNAKGMLEQMTGVPIGANAVGRQTGIQMPRIDPLAPQQVTQAAEAGARAALATPGVLETYRKAVDARGDRTGGYLDRRGDKTHKGVDDAYAAGTAIRAPLTSRVAKTGFDANGWGNYAILEYSNGIKELFGHMRTVMVKTGQQIAQSTKIGEVGSTGRSTGPHVHRERRDRNGNLMNPDGPMPGVNNRFAATNGNDEGGVIRYTKEGLAAVRSMETAVTNVHSHTIKLTAEEVAARQAAFNNYLANYQAEVGEIDRVRDKTIAFIQDVTNARAFGMQEIRRQREAAFADIFGVPQEMNVAAANDNVAMGGFNEEARRSREAQMTGGGGNLGASLQAKQMMQLMELRAEQASKIYEIQKLGYITGQDTAQLEADINAMYERRAILIEENSDKQREAFAAMAEDLKQRAHENGNTGDDMLLGLNAALLDFAATVPTVFETMRDLATTALTGIADVGAGILTGTEKNAKEAVANILRSMAQLLAKMVIMYAMIQLINLVPGGPALLKAMDLGAGLGGGSGGGGFKAPVFNGLQSNIPATPFAKGGVGGVARDPQLALFGEGRHPEAYIPMEDHRSIPVRIDDNGNAFVPLPSGQIIPVSLSTGKMRKFASGGIGYSGSRALRADNMNSSSPEAVSRHRNTPGKMQPANVNNRTMISVPITINGNATSDDADRIGNEVAKRIDRMMQEREAENARQYQRRGGSVAADYGVR